MSRNRRRRGPAKRLPVSFPGIPAFSGAPENLLRELFKRIGGTGLSTGEQVEEAARHLLRLQIFGDTWRAPLVMLRRVQGAVQVAAGAELAQLVHLVLPGRFSGRCCGGPERRPPVHWSNISPRPREINRPGPPEKRNIRGKSRFGPAAPCKCPSVSLYLLCEEG